MSGPAHESSTWMEDWFGKTERVIVSNPDPALWPNGEASKAGDVIQTKGHIENAADKVADKLDGTLTLVVLGLVALAVVVVMK